jgi:UPF0716 protein FxsA
VNPLWFLLLIVIGFPLFELYLLIEVGSFIGALPTIALSVFTALLGGTLMRVQGLSASMRAQATMARGEAPAMEMIEGVAIFMAGALLLLPGFFTDAVGFLLLIPPVRRLLILFLLSRAQVIRPVDPSRGPSRQTGQHIEGEYRRLDE